MSITLLHFFLLSLYKNNFLESSQQPHFTGEKTGSERPCHCYNVTQLRSKNVELLFLMPLFFENKNWITFSNKLIFKSGLSWEIPDMCFYAYA